MIVGKSSVFNLIGLGFGGVSIGFFFDWRAESIGRNEHNNVMLHKEINNVENFMLELKYLYQGYST